MVLPIDGFTSLSMSRKSFLSKHMTVRGVDMLLLIKPSSNNRIRNTDSALVSWVSPRRGHERLLLLPGSRFQTRRYKTSGFVRWLFNSPTAASGWNAKNSFHQHTHHTKVPRFGAFGDINQYIFIYESCCIYSNWIRLYRCTE